VCYKYIKQHKCITSPRCFLGNKFDSQSCPARITLGCVSGDRPGPGNLGGRGHTSQGPPDPGKTIIFREKAKFFGQKPAAKNEKKFVFIKRKKQNSFCL